jgi:hypothetical protein
VSGLGTFGKIGVSREVYLDFVERLKVYLSIDVWSLTTFGKRWVSLEDGRSNGVKQQKKLGDQIAQPAFFFAAFVEMVG